MQAVERPAGAEKVLGGKVSLITGGGSGVGRSVAELFARSGSTVMVVDVIPQRVDEVVRAIKEGGGTVKGMVADLSSGTESERIVDQTVAELGRVDILCNNAGIMDGVRPAGDVPDEVWDKVMAVNLNAPFRSSRRAIPLMLKQGGGVILNTASLAGVFGGFAGVAYTVSKHGLIGLTKSIAAHYGSKGIRCNAMVLGGVSTNIGVGSAQPDKMGMEHLMKAVSMMPRPGDPKEVAELALFLSSTKASFINGSCIVIDAGWSVF